MVVRVVPTTPVAIQSEPNVRAFYDTLSATKIAQMDRPVIIADKRKRRSHDDEERSVL